MEFQTPQATKKSNKKGLVKVLLLLVVIVVAGLAGWKWYGQVQEYQNKVAEQDQRIYELQNELKKLKEEESAEPATEVVSLTEWGVEVPLGDNSSTFGTSFENGYYYITSKLAGCTLPQQVGSANVGAISRYMKSEKITSEEAGRLGDDQWASKTWAEYYNGMSEQDGVVTLEDYIYDFNGPQSGCAEYDAKGEETNRQHRKLTEEFKALFLKLRTASADSE